MCDKCGKECCRVVITKQGERGPQGPIGPPGQNATIEAANVKTELTALGWFKQKVTVGLVSTLEFFSALGSSSIEITATGNDRVFSIKETAIIPYAIPDIDISSTKFTIDTVFGKSFAYKELHNDMVACYTSLELLMTYTGTTGENDVDVTISNLPVSFSVGVTQRTIGSLKQSIVTPTELDTVECFHANTNISFGNSSMSFTNGNQYRLILLSNTILIKN